MSTEVKLMTADDLLALPRGQFRYELIDGELKKVSPAGHNHGRITLTEKDTLDAGSVIPGFQYPIAKLFTLKFKE